MKKLILQCFIYSFLIIIALEVLVRIFHLNKDTPNRFLDEYEVEKWVPNQNGFSVTGNRKQNFSEYRINDFGYNSYREFLPTKDKIEIALVGDSFIEGFHQPYYNSIGRKIETKIPGIEVYEYGYAGYDFADQLHLVYAYQKEFEAIDHVIFGIKFSNDLTRGTYQVLTERLALQSPINNLLKKSKLLVYCKSIGVLDPPLNLLYKIKRLFNQSSEKKPIQNASETSKIKKEKEERYLKNFCKLVAKYRYDKNRFTLLLDSSITPALFLTYLNKNGFNYIDFYQSFKNSDHPTTLIYDRHWNNHGRTLIANEVVKFLRSKTPLRYIDR